MLVDEWQDTNRVQYDIVRLLATPVEEETGPPPSGRSLMVVGDMDQSIYGFRGAHPGSLDCLLDDFPACATLLLENNYRSTAPIAAAANAVMAQAADRQQQEQQEEGGAHHKTVRAVRTDGDHHRIAVVEAHDADGEAAFVALEAARLMEDPGVRTLGALFRMNAQAKALETACRKAGVPHRVVGGLGFFAHTELRDALAYLRVLENPGDAASLRRVINKPSRGIGPMRERAFFELFEEAVQAAAAAEAGGQPAPSLLTFLFAFLPEEELEEGLGAVLRRHGEKLGRMRAEARRRERGLEEEEEEEEEAGGGTERGDTDTLLQSVLDPGALGLARALIEEKKLRRPLAAAVGGLARVMMVLAAKACTVSVPALLSEVALGEEVGLAAHYAAEEGRRARLAEAIAEASEGYAGAGPAWGGALGRYLEGVLTASDGADEGEEKPAGAAGGGRCCCS